MSYLESIPVKATEDLSTTQYQAINIDGTIANNNGEAIGIQQNKGVSGRDLTAGFLGRSRYKAGDTVTAGARLTVATSGYMTVVASNELGCGTALSAVASGGISEGIFNFAGVRSDVSSSALT